MLRIWSFHAPKIGVLLFCSRAEAREVKRQFKSDGYNPGRIADHNIVFPEDPEYAAAEEAERRLRRLAARERSV